MTNPEALVYLFIGFLGILGSVILVQNDFFPYSRLVILVTTSIACAIVGSIFYRSNKPKRQTMFKPITSVPTRKQIVREAFFVSLGIFEVIILLTLPIFTWQIVLFNGIPLITPQELISIGFFIAGLYTIRVLYRFFKSNTEERIHFF
jgi:predicted membrane channel-forming protein YqfA (hemolysin III family)